MKVVQINTVCGSGSTGKICVGISKMLNSQGIENYIIYSYEESDYPLGIKCSEVFPKLQALRSRVLGNYGFNSKKTTKRIIEELERIEPDIVHLHNLHGHNCNLEMLVDYLKEKKIKLFWTFHDCWAFTAYCPHYVMAVCQKWKTGCYNCVQARTFSWFADRSRWLYEKKKQIFADLNLTIITPSQWLADQVKLSFLKEYPVKVINNGIDLSVFYPRESGFREKYHLENKCVLLGVAFGWGPRKGLDVFIRLAERLDHNKFQIVLVGTDKKVDRLLPKNIISIHRTANQAELAEIYSAADLFVNPTREEVLGLVNLEALACGTPVITFRTGGSPECIDEKTGVFVECDDEESLCNKIICISESSQFERNACVHRAREFDESTKYNEYIQRYQHK